MKRMPGRGERDRGVEQHAVVRAGAQAAHKGEDVEGVVGPGRHVTALVGRGGEEATAWDGAGEDAAASSRAHRGRRLRGQRLLGQAAAPRPASVPRTACFAAAIATAFIESSRAPRPSSSGTASAVAGHLAADGEPAGRAPRRPRRCARISRSTAGCSGSASAATSRVAALGRQRVLRQVVRAHREEVDERRELLREQGRRRHLEHHADLEASGDGDALVAQGGPGLVQQRPRPAQLVDGGHHREHDAHLVTGGDAQDGAQLAAQLLGPRAGSAAGRGRPGTGSPPAAARGTGAACRRRRRASAPSGGGRRGRRPRPRRRRPARPRRAWPSPRGTGTPCAAARRRRRRRRRRPARPAGPAMLASTAHGHAVARDRRPGRRGTGGRGVASLPLASPSRSPPPLRRGGATVTVPASPSRMSGVAVGDGEERRARAGHGRQAERAGEDGGVRRRPAGGAERCRRTARRAERGDVGRREVRRRRRCRRPPPWPPPAPGPARCASTCAPTSRRSAARARW